MVRVVPRQRDLSELLADDPPPTHSDLDEVRLHRDGLWRQIREHGLLGRTDEFEQAGADADRIADLMLKHAERITRRQQLEQTVARHEDRLTHQNEDLCSLDERRQVLESDRTALWADYPGSAPDFVAAAELLDQVTRLQAAKLDLDNAEAKKAALTELAEQHVRRLTELLHDPAATDTMVRLGGNAVLADLPELQEVAQDRLTEHDESRQQRAILETLATDAARTHLEALSQVTIIEQELEIWTVEWRLLLKQSGLPESRDPDMAMTDLERLAEASAKSREASEADRNSDRDEHRIARYRELLSATAAVCARPLPSAAEHWHQVVASMRTDVHTQRSDFERRSQLVVERNSLNSELNQTLAQLTAADHEIRELADRTGVPEDELEDAIDRRSRKELAERSLSELTQALPSSELLDRLIDQAAATDEDTLQEELTAGAKEISELETQSSAHLTALTLNKDALARLNGSADAASAEWEVSMLTSELVDNGEQYLRVELAAAFLRACMDRYQQTDQDPLLDRASGYFQRITEGEYSGLALAEDSDVPVVQARLTNGTALSLNQLSEGTADQLYFALRLATLERHADEDRTLPLTIDDIFMTFDDGRTRAALSVLDDLADRFQIIVFTHHDEVVTSAASIIASDRLHIHELPAPRSHRR